MFKILNTKRLIRFLDFFSNGIANSYLRVKEMADNWIIAIYTAYKLNSCGE